MVDLKPCPFCGNKPEIKCTSSGIQSGEVNGFYRQYKLWCPNCGCNTGRVSCVSFDYSPHTGLRADESKLNEAIKAWNRREEDGNEA